MAEKVSLQQPVISIRISELLRSRLEHLKEIMHAKSGQPVSTSEAAKQLLESARDDRLELVNLLIDPTDSLLKIRGKAEAQLTLSLAEWTLVAYYGALGAESFVNSRQGQISFETLTDILEAFQSTYEIARKPKRTPKDFQYLMYLPSDKQAEDKEPEEIGGDDVRRVVKNTIRMLKNSSENRKKPILAVRNLYTLLDGERFTNIEKLNDALRPHWDALWRVCARGHYARHAKPLREKPAPVSPDEDEENFDDVIQPPLPSLQEGEYRLDLVREEGNDFSTCLHFPGRLAPRYPVGGYPRIAEFRRMLETIDSGRPFCFWRGRYFFAYTELMENCEDLAVSFRAYGNGITFSFPVADWQSICNLFRRAWQSPEVARLWGEQMLEYGEL